MKMGGSLVQTSSALGGEGMGAGGKVPSFCLSENFWQDQTLVNISLPLQLLPPCALMEDIAKV